MPAGQPDTESAGRDLTEATLSSSVAWQGAFLKVRDDTVRLPDGSHARREYVTHPGAVIIVPMLDDNTYVLERQFRYPLHRHFIEFPAGKIDAGEPPIETAKRELKEETGYEAGEWHRLALTHPCIGYSNEIIELHVARDLRHTGAALDAGEFLDVIKMSRRELLANIRSGLVTDTKTVFAALWIEQFGYGELKPQMNPDATGVHRD
ncbi:MAG: NUDIX hydrolase [Betaproteobacteria bacterium]|nr:NUDIX hydrolase [Betaproteobacteria bacterium]